MSREDVVANFVMFGLVILFVFLFPIARREKERQTRVIVASVWLPIAAVALLMLGSYARLEDDVAQVVILAGLAVIGACSVVWAALLVARGTSGAQPAPAAQPPGYVPPRPFKPTWGRPRFVTASQTRYAGYRRAGKGQS